MKMVQDIIIKPIITEASMDKLAEKKYTFKVAADATKPEIAKAVEELFKVNVLCVRTINMKKKPKRLGVHFGYTSEWKKAIVTLKPDSKTIVNMLNALGSEKKALIVLPEVDKFVIKSSANIPGVVTSLYNTINVYDILNADKFIISKAAVEKLEEVFA